MKVPSNNKSGRGYVHQKPPRYGQDPLSRQFFILSTSKSLNYFGPLRDEPPLHFILIYRKEIPISRKSQIFPTNERSTDSTDILGNENAQPGRQDSADGGFDTEILTAEYANTCIEVEEDDAVTTL